jgi:hypothetical protein
MLTMKSNVNRAEARKQREQDFMEMAMKEADGSGRILTKGQRKELAKEMAKKMYEDQIAEGAKKAKEAKQAKAIADKM